MKNSNFISPHADQYHPVWLALRIIGLTPVTIDLATSDLTDVHGGHCATCALSFNNTQNKEFIILSLQNEQDI